MPLGTIVFLSGSPNYPLFIFWGAVGVTALRALIALVVMMVTTGRSEKLNPREAIIMANANATFFSILATRAVVLGVVPLFLVFVFGAIVGIFFSAYIAQRFDEPLWLLLIGSFPVPVGLVVCYINRYHGRWASP